MKNREEFNIIIFPKKSCKFTDNNEKNLSRAIIEYVVVIKDIYIKKTDLRLTGISISQASLLEHS